MCAGMGFLLSEISRVVKLSLISHAMASTGITFGLLSLFAYKNPVSMAGSVDAALGLACSALVALSSTNLIFRSPPILVLY